MTGYGILVGTTWYWYKHWFGKVIEKLGKGWTRPKKVYAATAARQEQTSAFQPHVRSLTALDPKATVRQTRDQGMYG